MDGGGHARTDHDGDTGEGASAMSVTGVRRRLLAGLVVLAGLSLLAVRIHQGRMGREPAEPPPESADRAVARESDRPALDPADAAARPVPARRSPSVAAGALDPAGPDDPVASPGFRSNAGRDGDVASFVAMARDVSIDAVEREQRIMELGRQGGPDAARRLMALGDEDTYLNFAALQALAGIPDPAVADYLTRKLEHGDPRMVAVAAVSLAAVQGPSAVASIAETLERNRLRPDGQQDVVCAACVEALQQIGDPAALPVLAAELDQTVGVSLSYDYGARIVSAIRAIGDPAGIATLQSYADRLRALQAAATDNPQAQHFFQREIDKTMAAITYIEREEE